jgi:NDP-sugar pyrophosphorylase family protein
MNQRKYPCSAILLGIPQTACSDFTENPYAAQVGRLLCVHCNKDWDCILTPQELADRERIVK